VAGKYDIKFLDAQGVKYLWDKAEGIYVQKEEGKLLSDENFTTAEKEKLAGLTAYQLPNASADTLGGVKIGTGLSIDASGVVSATGEVEADIEALSFDELEVILKSPSTEAALITCISEGGDITLTRDLTITQPINVIKNTTIDLGGHTLTATFEDYIFMATNVRLTILNGTINAQYRIAQARDGGHIVIARGTYTSANVAFVTSGINSRIDVNAGEITGAIGGIGVFDGSIVNINGGIITALDNFGVFTNKTDIYGHNTINMNGGRIVGQTHTDNKASCGIFIANRDTFTMNGGEIISENGCGLLMRSGTAVITNGLIIAEGVNPGTVGNDDAIVTHSAIIFHQTSGYTHSQSMGLTIDDGRFVGVQHSVEILSNEVEPNVHISGGYFSPANF
jgi:hypothetical protein